MKAERILTWVVRGVAGLLVLSMIYLGYLLVADRLQDRKSSLAGRASENLVKLVKQKPNDVKLRLRLAESLGAAGRLREAAEQYNAALKIDPKSASALSGLGMLAMKSEEWSKAQGYWEKIIDLLEETQYAAQDKRLEQSYFYLGSCLIEQEKYEDALGYLKRALVLRRDASDTYYAIAYTYGKLDIPEKQRENLEFALMFDPMLAEANFDLGNILLAADDVAGAAECFRKSADAAPDDKPEPREALEKLGSHEDRLAKANQLAAGDPAKALVEARVANALKPDDIETVRLIAKLYEKTGDLVAARDTWDALLRLAPNDPEAQEAPKRLEKVAK